MFDLFSKKIDEFGNSVFGALNNLQSFFGKDLTLARPLKKDIYSAIGNTPLVRLNNLGKEWKSVNLLLKAEFLNPTGNVKDRTALGMILDAEKRGILKPGNTIIDSDGGNISVSLAWIGRARGYKIISCLSDKSTPDIVKKLRMFGAVTLYPSGGENPAVAMKKEAVGVVLDQYGSVANANIHFGSTGPEIWRDLAGNVDAFVCSADSGGTIAGTGRYLKSQKESISVIAGLQLEDTPFGLKQGYVEAKKNSAPLIDDKLFSGKFSVHVRDIIQIQNQLIKEEGIFAGCYTALCVSAAMKYLESMAQDAEANIVIMAPDSLESTGHGFFSRSLKKTPELVLKKELTEIAEQLKTPTFLNLNDSINKIMSQFAEMNPVFLPIKNGDEIIGGIEADHLLQTIATKGRGVSIYELIEPSVVKLENDSTILDTLVFFDAGYKAVKFRDSAGAWRILTQGDVIRLAGS